MTQPRAITGDRRRKILVTSSVDGTAQPNYLILPERHRPHRPAPVLVSLHTWSCGCEQRNLAMEEEAARRGWIYLFPDFRGPNDRPEALGSLKAQQDILDAVAWVRERYRVDEQRINLTGLSGGGHMAMLMAGRHPDRWAAVSAWVGISDLAAWHACHQDDHYGRMVRDCCGGPPGARAEVDAEYRARSPLSWLRRAVDLPLDLCAGVHDGHTGSVPIRQTLAAFNAVAAAQGLPGISDDDIEQISRPGGRLDRPQAGDTVEDATFGRAIYLRRRAGHCRVTVFEGGHEGLAGAAAAFLEPHAKSA